MTVRELIERLKDYGGDLPVWVPSNGGGNVLLESVRLGAFGGQPYVQLCEEAE